MSTDRRMLRGACACGTLSYRVADDFEYAWNCHCSQCRAATGAACKPFGGAPTILLMADHAPQDVLVVGDGEGDHDVRCRACGSLLYSVVREGRFVHVAYGTLRDAPALAPQLHIFVGSKAPWHTITDDLPQHDELP